jgi:predicted metal-dependent enzyme (double-stranded beta helix superfamily)
MSYSMERFASDIRSALKADPGPGGKQAVCEIVGRALLDDALVEQYLQPEDCKPRKVLYEDPELGFCICGHVYLDAAKGGPHDHGSSWAIYGLARGDTEMTDWKIVRPGSGDQPSLVEPEKVYTLQPGDAHFYDVGVVHSPDRAGPTKLFRIEGKNLDHIKRSNIKAA